MYCTNFNQFVKNNLRPFFFIVWIKHKMGTCCVFNTFWDKSISFAFTIMKTLHAITKARSVFTLWHQQHCWRFHLCTNAGIKLLLPWHLNRLISVFGIPVESIILWELNCHKVHKLKNWITTELTSSLDKKSKIFSE